MKVLMFHSVGNTTSQWFRNWLSVSIEHFENFCQYLVKNNYQTVHLNEWYLLHDQSDAEKKKLVVLTFDDGYLDNWVFVFPILKKYNLKGTIFINPEFVNAHNEVRQNLDDFWEKKIKMDELETLGFLNWPEIQELDRSGVMDIQSHSMSHNFYFRSDKIIDIYSGQPKYDWLAWYFRPERKPYYITEDQRSLVPSGYPIYESGRALGLRRYFPNERLVDYAVKMYSSENESKDKNNLISRLIVKAKELPGTYESDEEMEARYRYELFESKKILEEKLNKKVEFLCWPGGGYNELSIKISNEAGYKASTISSIERKTVTDNTGHYKRIHRLGMGSVIRTGERITRIKNRNVLIHRFKGKSGNLFYMNFIRSRKLFYIIKEKIRNTFV